MKRKGERKLKNSRHGEGKGGIKYREEIKNYEQENSLREKVYHKKQNKTKKVQQTQIIQEHERALGNQKYIH